MRYLLAALLPLLALAQDAPRLFYSKTFPNSRPAYCEVRVERDGKALYREDPADDNPVAFSLSPEETEAVFQLADKLEHFKKPLESGLKVARMGDKLFRWEKAAEKYETKFNYTQDLDGQQMLDWFERMAESGNHFIYLERTVKYDKLGVNQALLNLEASWDRKRLVGVSQYLPLLDRIVKNESYLQMARHRAAKLAEIFRNPPPAEAKGQ